MKSSLFSFAKQSIFDILSIVITLFCIGFVIYKGEECFSKYLENPKSTDVAIEHAHKHPYPAISICQNDIYSNYEGTLKKCNLTYLDYYNDFKWVGLGSEAFCSDPAELYRVMTGNRGSVLSDVKVTEYEIVATDQNFTFKDDVWNGRCYTYEAPTDMNLMMWQGWVHKDAYIFIHTPGSFFWSDYKEFVLPTGYDLTVDVMHEVFNVLEFDGEACNNYVFGRDECIHRIIHEVIQGHKITLQQSLLPEVDLNTNFRFQAKIGYLLMSHR